jgi:hypothetical protein
MAVDIALWNIMGARIIHDGIDLGVVKDISPTENVTEYQFSGSYDGQIYVYDEAVTGGDLAFNFVSSMVLDTAVQTLWAGGTAGVLKRGFSEAAVTQLQGISGIPGKGGLTFTFPQTRIRRNGFPAFTGEAEAQFPFTLKVLFDSASGSYGSFASNSIVGGA